MLRKSDPTHPRHWPKYGECTEEPSAKKELSHWKVLAGKTIVFMAVLLNPIAKPDSVDAFEEKYLQNGDGCLAGSIYDLTDPNSSSFTNTHYSGHGWGAETWINVYPGAAQKPALHFGSDYERLKFAIFASMPHLEPSGATIEILKDHGCE